jgi:hypothetical protein
MRNPVLEQRPVDAKFTRPSRAAVREEACCQSCFDEVWKQVNADPYTALPNQVVTLASFFKGFHYRLLEAGRRTTRKMDDLLPRFDKLIRPNGLCLSGTWKIDQETRYTGLLASGANGKVIARASVAFRETRAGHIRAFGLAGKVFPSLDGSHIAPSANFFVIDDNGGTETRHFQDAIMSNKPKLSLNRSSLASLPLLIAITVAQRIADSHSETRQLYPLAQAGIANPNVCRAPRFLQLRGLPGPRVEADDFRDAVRLAMRRAPVKFELAVRDDERTPFRAIGSMELDECVASESCDHRLHFAHPPWRAESSPAARR